MNLGFVCSSLGLLHKKQTLEVLGFFVYFEARKIFLSSCDNLQKVRWIIFYEWTKFRFSKFVHPVPVISYLYKEASDWLAACEINEDSYRVHQMNKPWISLKRSLMHFDFSIFIVLNFSKVMSLRSKVLLVVSPNRLGNHHYR